MKVLSLWQPYASLVAHNCKHYETRPKAPPRTMKIGDRFAIASTKQIKPEQETAADNPRLQRYLRNCMGLPEWRVLPRGQIIATVVLGEPFEITRAFVMELGEEEYVYGDWRLGRWAWPVSDPVVLQNPVLVRGQQGVWDYHGDLN